MLKISANQAILIVLAIYFNYIIKISSIKTIIEAIATLQKYQIAILVKYNLLILVCNLYYAISFLYSINSDFLNYNYSYFIRIVLIKYYSIFSKDNYYSKLIVIKVDLKIRFKLFRLNKINYSKISINLYYQILQTRLFRNNFSFIFFKITIIRFNSNIFSICNSNNKLAHIIVKSTKTKILIKRIILIIKNITIRKVKNTILRIVLQKNKITISKSSFFRF